MKTPRLFLSAAATLLTLTTTCLADPKPGTADATTLGEKYMRSMSDTLAHAKTFTFETDEQLQILTPEGKKRELQLDRKITVRRPNGMAFELHGKTDAEQTIDAYYDGKTATLTNAKTGVWAQTAVPANIGEMLDDVSRQYGLPVPIGDVMYDSPYDAYLGKNSKGGFVAREAIDGVSYAVVDFADDVVGIRMWIPSEGQALPRRVVITYKQAPVPLATQVNFTNWKLDVPVKDSMFTFQPPAENHKVEFAEFVAALVGGPNASPVSK